MGKEALMGPGRWDEAIGFLDSLLNYETTGGYAKFLERFQELLHRLGHPQNHPAKKVLIVGTKGKGSVAAHITRALVNQGLSVGTYTSPHVRSITERIKLNDKPISERELADMILRIKPYVALNRGFSTWFETMTAASFLFFKEHNADFWVLEAGLGGRLDATNAVKQDITVITRLGLDHTHILGNDIASIAREKAGAIKQGPVFTVPQEEPAMRVIEEVCEKQGADLRIVEFETEQSTLEGNTVKLNGQLLHTPLVGAFQAENLALAASALAALGLPEPDFSGTTNPGRFQVIERDGKTLILDSAHNPLALKTVLEEVSRFWPGRKPVVVFGTSRRKNTAEMLKLLRDVSGVILTRANTPKAAEPFLMEQDAAMAGLKTTRTKDVAQALEAAQAHQLILITGSVYVVGEALEILGL